MFPIKTNTTSYTQARDNFASLLDRIESENSIAIIQRRGHKDMAILAADELESILETIHLIRSPNNARRLLDAIDRSQKRENSSPTPESIEKLCEDLGIEREKTQ
ncbi:MAG: type II toxin-antitoxin system Phd/YefM family antitoxin [Prochloraceae cyanobacterium]